MPPLSDHEVEQLFAQWRTPAAGRTLIRSARGTALAPVRQQQHLNGAVRTLFQSKKMGRGLMAESRTCELPGLYIREHDQSTLEMWPQPFQLSIPVEAGKGKTIVSHLPDLLLITDEGFLVEEWREEARLERLASERPHRYFKDEQGAWRDRYVEPHLKNMGITYRLRSADEHPRIFLANLDILADFSLASTPPVPENEAIRLQTLLSERLRCPYLELLEEHGFKPEHVLQSVLSGSVYVDLYTERLIDTDELLVYRDEYVVLAERLAARSARPTSPDSILEIEQGTEVDYDGVKFKVLLVGKEKVSLVNGATGEIIELELSVVRHLHKNQLLKPLGLTVEEVPAAFEMVLSNKKLIQAAKRLAAFERGKSDSGMSERTWQRIQSALRGKESPHERLLALVPKTAGNATPRLPAETYEIAERTLKERFNTPIKQTLSSAYSHYVNDCNAANVQFMSRTRFFEWARPRTNTRQREGKRRDYATAPIPLTFNYGSPVHGVLPHEVAYCDHTPLNIRVRGRRIPIQSRPVLTVMVDGSNSGARAFFISFRAAGVHSVFMCLRDYVRRWGVLPRILVLDNGKEFHSHDLTQFCKLFGITVRWRRSAKPRDSGIVERFFGTVETELLQQLAGNSIHMKDPRAVSSSHYPEKHARSTLASLHGQIDYLLFDIHRHRVHPRLGVSPAQLDEQTEFELGRRAHRMVRYDELFKLLTSPHPRVATRKIDPQRGIFVEGVYYWHDAFKDARWVRAAHVEVRVELWNAEVVYACYRDKWLVARSRDSSGLKGRFRPELAVQAREERAEGRRLAQQDKFSPATSSKRVKLWDHELWDEATRDALMIEHALYARLGMVEAHSEAINHEADVNYLPPPLLGWEEVPEDAYVEDSSVADGPTSSAHENASEAIDAPGPTAEFSGADSTSSAPSESNAASVPMQSADKRSEASDGSVAKGRVIRPAGNSRTKKDSAVPKAHLPPKQRLDDFIRDLDGDTYF
jgi:putative transposase